MRAPGEARPVGCGLQGFSVAGGQMFQRLECNLSSRVSKELWKTCLRLK